MKNSAARTAVVRDRKFAAPVAPNRLPDAPPPKPEPMSAPLPCWSSTRPMMASATSTWSTISTLVQKLMSSSLQDFKKFFRHERGAADQPAVDVGHGENRRGVLRLDAAAIENARLGQNFFPQKAVHFLRLLRSRRAPGTDGPHRLVGHHRF